jgi:hypothetical protein
MVWDIILAVLVFALRTILQLIWAIIFFVSRCFATAMSWNFTASQIVDIVISLVFNFPGTIKEWAINNPWTAALQLILAICSFIPGLCSGPILWALGWTAQGPGAGKFASYLKIHNRIWKTNWKLVSWASHLNAWLGNVGARSFFAYLQSAATGGYGAPVVAFITRVFAFVASAIGILTSKLDGRASGGNVTFTG